MHRLLCAASALALISGAAHAAITHNYLQSLAFTGPPPGQGEPDMGTWMMVRQQANAITFKLNATLQGQVTTLTNALTLATKQLNASKSQASQAIQILATPLPTK